MSDCCMRKAINCRTDSQRCKNDESLRDNVCLRIITCKSATCATLEGDSPEVANETDVIKCLEAELRHVHAHHLLAGRAALPLLHCLACHLYDTKNSYYKGLSKKTLEICENENDVNANIR